VNRPVPHAAQTQGFTLVELLIVMALGGLLLTALLQLVLSSQRLYQADSARAAINQDVSVAIAAISNDVRQAGERLTADFPAVQVAGASGQRSITVRRSVLDVVLPVCKDIKSGTATDVVFVSKKGNGGSLPASCKEDSSEVGFNAWVSYRKANGGTVDAYLFDPVTGLGETFSYDAEDNSGQHIHKGPGKWLNNYPVVNQPRVYILEETTYAQDGTSIMLKRGSQAAVAFLPNVQTFEIEPIVVNSGTRETITGNFPTNKNSWKDLNTVRLSLTASQQAGGKTVSRTFTSEFVPRNVFSENQ
jgi:prepilin-type N-terminal cleavage/methylation domain-containing protein